MGTTFLKRQKEMKRLEKQREKAERRAQKKTMPQDENATAETDTDIFIPDFGDQEEIATINTGSGDTFEIKR